MKTAMTQFLEWLENSSDVQNDILDWGTVKKNALEKEKEQIIDAYEYGQINVNEDGCLNEENGAKEYYNQTYNQNK
jgi:hypothetical protein